MLKSLLSAGVPLALGSDAGPDEANPFLNIMVPSTYKSPGEALTRSKRCSTPQVAHLRASRTLQGRIMTGGNLACCHRTCCWCRRNRCLQRRACCAGGRRYRIRIEPVCRAIYQAARRNDNSIRRRLLSRLHARVSWRCRLPSA
jgi:hypothetical protein